MANTIQKLGWKKDPLDPRDYHLATRKLKTAQTISLFDSYNTPPVYDQGNLGSCVSNEIAAWVEFKLMNKNPNGDPNAKLYMPSRLFNYYYGRTLEGTVNEDSGLTIRDGIKALVKYGIADEDKWAYDVKKFRERPNDDAIAEATKFKASTYRRVSQTLDGFLTSLRAGQPVIFGFAVFESFMSDEVAKTGKVPMPDIKNEQFLGGHCVAIWGYNREGNYILCRNSWGKDWGINGYFHMPLNYALNASLASDFWMIDGLVNF